MNGMSNSSLRTRSLIDIRAKAVGNGNGKSTVSLKIHLRYTISLD